MSAYLRFERRELEGRKTPIVTVISQSGGYALGEIRWYDRWRQFCFYPEAGVLRSPKPSSDRGLSRLSSSAKHGEKVYSTVPTEECMSFQSSIADLTLRELGEDVRSRLFPTPKMLRREDGTVVEGPTPYPLPVLVGFTSGEVPISAWFIRESSGQRVGDLSTDPVPPDRVLVVTNYPTTLAFSVELSFGKSPELPAGLSEALITLLQAVCGL